MLGLGQDWLVPPLPREFDDPAEAEWAARAAHAAPGRLLHRAGPAGAPAGGLPVHPHLHQGDRGARPPEGGPFWAAADRAKASPAWDYHEIATNHMVASNRPGELTRLLLDLT